MDTDYEPLRAIDELLHGCRAFVGFEGRHPELGTFPCGGMVGATPGHPLLHDLIAAVSTSHNPDVPNSLGPLMVHRVVKQHVDVRLFEKDVLIGPWDYKTRHEIPSNLSTEDCPLGKWLRTSMKSFVTIGVTSFMRPESLKRLVDSIARYYPDLPLEVVDTKGNLSWDRHVVSAVRVDLELQSVPAGSV